MKVNVSVEAEITQDSLEYDQLAKAIYKTIDVPGYTCEIGLRGGGGSFYMMNALRESKQNKTKGHIAVDPYGNIEYPSNDKDLIRQDYTNLMRDDCLLNLRVHLVQSGSDVDFHFFNLEDTEFFNRYADGIPMYNQHKFMMNTYSVASLDGPHSSTAIKAEIDFFHPRMEKGAIIIFDDIDLYGHDQIVKYMRQLDWHSIAKGERKESFQKG